jgi:hypothetical protein
VNDEYAFVSILKEGHKRGAIQLGGYNFVEKQILFAWFSSVIPGEFW